MYLYPEELNTCRRKLHKSWFWWELSICRLTLKSWFHKRLCHLQKNKNAETFALKRQNSWKFVSSSVGCKGKKKIVCFGNSFFFSTRQRPWGPLQSCQVLLIVTCKGKQLLYLPKCGEGENLCNKSNAKAGGTHSYLHWGSSHQLQPIIN